MERYEKYKDSGVEWIGEIPEEWGVKKLKRLIKNLESGVSVNSTDFPASNVSYGILKTSCVYNYFFDPKENKEIWQSELIRAKINPRKGELIISRMNTPDLVGASGYVENDHANLFLPDRLWQTKFYEHVALDTKWLSFVTKSLPFRKHLSILATGTSPSMKNLAQEDFLNIDIPFPKQREQTAIANYLDRKTAEIDALIAQKERLIALYEEEKTAIINQAVTQGIDPNAKLKESGIDWLGEIPVGWDTKKLKHFIESLESGVSVNSTDFPASENSFGVLKTSCVYNYQFDPSENKEIWHTEIERAKINPQEGQLIISRMNTPDLVGASGYVEQSYPNLFLPDRLWQTKFFRYAVINTRWLSFLIKSVSFRKLLSILATGTSPSMKNLSQEDFLNIDIPYPTEIEQTALVYHIETETARIDAKIAKTPRIIELQKEYRTALISEVVTGKIKVSHLVDKELAQ
ncbi:MAG: hypothetical protein ABL925_12845 [Methylococcales bacterium]